MGALQTNHVVALAQFMESVFTSGPYTCICTDVDMRTDTHTNPSQLNYSEFGLHYELLKKHEKEKLKTEAWNYQLIVHKEAIDPKKEGEKKKQLFSISSLCCTNYKQWGQYIYLAFLR